MSRPASCPLALLFLSSIFLAACHHGAPSAPSHVVAVAASQAPVATIGPVYRNDRLGLVVHYRDGVTASQVFEPHYLLADRWAWGMPPEVPGTPLLQLTLPGSNDVLRAELRMGVSANPRALETCTHRPAMARGAPGKARMAGMTWTTFRGGGAAMSHHLAVRAYRLVRRDHCLAVDLIVAGTDPMVYEPPRRVPFTAQQAWQRLEGLLGGIRLQP